nr:MAG TPA: hypothetical protein [Microviridae sp.]
MKYLKSSHILSRQFYFWYFVCFLGHPRSVFDFAHEIFEIVPQDVVRTVEIVEVNKCVVHHRILRCGHSDDCACVYIERVSGKYLINVKRNQLSAVKRG